jgi:hypothetical protein
MFVFSLDDNEQAPFLFIIYQKAVRFVAFWRLSQVWAADWLCRQAQAQHQKTRLTQNFYCLFINYVSRDDIK